MAANEILQKALCRTETDLSWKLSLKVHIGEIKFMFFCLPITLCSGFINIQHCCEIINYFFQDVTK